MNTQSRLAWLPMVAVTAVLMAILAFLYAKTRDYDDSNYFEHVALLRHVKQLDAQWELDVLKSKIGINKHYDPLADSLTELSVLLDKFESNSLDPLLDGSSELARGSAALRKAIQEKATLIERFKSNNSVLHNSLVFLPTAADEIRESLLGGRGSAASARVLAGVNKLLLASMLYSQSPSDERGADIRSELDRLEADRLSLAGDAGDRLEIFNAHVNTVLREQKVVNDLLSSIAVVPTASLNNSISNQLGDQQQRSAMQNRRYREYLLVFSAVLIGLFLYAAGRLIRSHAVINRVNKELQSANENLEQRVQERTHELQHAQNELVTTARQAGMAEIAINVLHNVGNVLNSVNVSAGLIASSVRASKIQGLARAVQLMNEHADDLEAFLASDPKGKMLPGYLGQLAQVLATEQQGVIEELTALTKSVDHIKEIIATQQAYAGASSLTELTQIGDLVEDALRMNAGALDRQHVVVEKEFAPVPDLPLDKGRILQILVNLIGNARQAMAGVVDREHRLALKVEAVQGQTLRIAVADNGVGIAQENLVRIFAHGFTTKKDGHGFGLHSAVVAAREMGGTLAAHSDGPGCGATFTLELPIKTTEETA